MKYKSSQKISKITVLLDINLATFSLFTFIQGNLSEQGKLIMQGSFQMSTEHKGKMKDLRFKPMQRQMFLHQKSILLCKRREDLNSTDKVIYSFKNLLKVRVRGHEPSSVSLVTGYLKGLCRYNKKCLVGGLGFNFNLYFTFLQLSQVGLTENVKGDKRKFELWLRGREEVYIIQVRPYSKFTYEYL